MGFLGDLFDSLLGTGKAEESTSSKNEENDHEESDREVRIEGRESRPHHHSDGSYGTDTYAAKVIYENGIKIHESDAGFGHISNGSENPNHVK